MTTRRTTRTLSALTGIALLAFAATACAGDPTPEATAIETDDLVAKLPAPAGPVDEVTWNLMAGEPTSLDPRNATTYSAGQVVNNLCDTLLTVDENLNVIPNLAEVEQVSATELKITLREGPAFWDGTPVTVDDVIYSLQRTADPEASLVAYAFASVASIDATGPQEVTITFSSPDTMLRAGLSTIAGAVLQKAWAEQAGEDVGTPGGGLMCSGPYELESWSSGSDIHLTANADYWNADRAPHAAAIRFTTLTDQSAVVQALNSGEIDGAYELPASTVPTLQDSPAGRMSFGPSTQWVSLDIATPGGPLADPQLREALQKAVDREAIATGVFAGAARPSFTAVGSGTYPNDTDEIFGEAAEKWIEARAYDPEAAKQLVAESGYDGTPIVLAIPSGDEALSRTAQIVQQQAKQAGIEITIDTLSPLLMAQAAYDVTAREGMDSMLTSSFNSKQDPLEQISFTHLSGEAYNYTDFDDDQVTALIEEARGEVDQTARAEQLVEALDIIEDANSSIPLVQLYTTSFTNDRLTGTITSIAYWTVPQMAFIGAAE